MIVVMPAAPHSFYVNSAVAAHAKYETFIVQELHEVVAHRFAVDTLREAIAGASMGGYGAAVLALRYPARYRFAGLIIPALSVPDSISKADSAFAPWAIPAVDTAFGPYPSPHRQNHDPFYLLLHTAPASLPYFYVSVAEGDEFPSFVSMSRAWTNALRTLKAPYEYHEMPGGHNDVTADAALAPLVRRWIDLLIVSH
jgi:S-formylglutathione hydrolase FrmB